LIFSLFKLRKKTTAVISGVAIALACLWGLSMWQDISRQEMLNMLFGTMLMLGGIMLLAFLLILALSLVKKIFQKITTNNSQEKNQGSSD